MKVSNYYPVFYTNDVEKETKRMTEELGFTVKHRPKIEYLDYAVLEDANNSRLDIVCSHFPADNFSEGFLGMRVNVDNFDEGVAYFEEQGYLLFGTAHETDSRITGLLVRDNKDYIILFHHKKK